MIARLIEWSLQNRPLVILAAIALAISGYFSIRNTPVDAIPDLSEIQVIVKTVYSGQAPSIVEAQVTYPLSSALLSVPGSSAVRGFSMLGESYIYVIFTEDVDQYWARSRVLEAIAQVQQQLPPGVTPTLGPDASGVGWVFEYALVDKSGAHNIDDLRLLQDYFLKYELQRLPGVAEVATVGGAVRQFQIEVNPHQLAAYGLTLSDISQAIRDANAAGSGSVIEMAQTEYAVKFEAYLSRLDDFRNIPLGSDKQGAPLRLGDVAHIQTGPELRRGATDLNGDGEVTGGIVVMRYGQNALTTIARVKQRLDELRISLPPEVEIEVTYDRSELIQRAVATLEDKLWQESLAVALVCLLFLFHLRSSLVIIISLPLGIAAAFVIMQAQGITANIMSLGGIAIAIGAMVDAAIVMVENMHKHLERAGEKPDFVRVALEAAQEVGPALFFCLLIIAISFMPVFALTAQEGRLFSPLAYTKTYAMAASAGLAVTLVPVLMSYFIRGKIAHEQRNPLSRALQAMYRPLLEMALRHRRLSLALAFVFTATAIWPLVKMGSEFMPPLDEGDLLYMPVTMPGISVDAAVNLLQITDRAIRAIPEVETVFGKAGRAETATDPAPLSMLETTIQLKPRDQWRDGLTMEMLIDELNRATRIPGMSNSWGYPIRTRIDMLSTGVRSPLGIKISGSDLDGIVALAQNMETILRPLPGTRSIFAERITDNHYIDVVLNRQQAARYGIRAADVQNLLQTAIGGENITTVVDGRLRFPVNVRYRRAFRDSVEAIASSRLTAADGKIVALGDVTTIRVIDGPAEIKSENGRLIGYIYLDIEGRDLGGYVARAKSELAQKLTIPPGYAIAWTGQYEHLERAEQRLQTIIPLTVVLVVLLLMMYLRDMAKTIMVLISLPFALVGGMWFVYLLDYQLSVATAVGFIALAGVAVEFGVVMLLYIENAWQAQVKAGSAMNAQVLRESILSGALLRIRPKVMTVSVILAGLLPIMLSNATGTDVMQRIAAPLIGGMLSAPLLSLFVLPVMYSLWYERPKANQSIERL